MFTSYNLLQSYLPKLYKLSTIFSNTYSINFYKFIPTLRSKMTTAKSFPDIYVLSDLSGLQTEMKKYLPEHVNVIEVPCQVTGKDKKISSTSLEILQKVEVLVTDGYYLTQLLYNLPSTKWVQNSWAGVEKIIKVLDPSKPLPNFTLTRYSDAYFGDSMANYVMAQIINIERKFYIYHDKQKVAEWDKSSIIPNFRVLSDLTIGVLGAGNIGAAVGRYLKRAGSWVIAFVRNPREQSSEDYGEAVTDLSRILDECDYICNVLPSTEETRGLLDNDVLKNCKKKPVFINVGRGDIIHPDNLLRALREGWISGAVLDVFVEEPLPPDNPLWKIPEVHITPHIGAVTTIQGLSKFTASNYLRYISCEPLMNVLDWNTGY